MARLHQIRPFFAVRDDPYAGGDLANAQRLGAVLWALVLILILILFPVTPPTDAIGEAGWIPAAAIAGSFAALVYLLRTGRIITTWRETLVVGYLAVIGLAALQWLSGGVGESYDRLLLLPVLWVGALHPPRKIAALLGVVLLALVAPLVYDRWDSAEAVADAASLIIWCGLALMVSLLMGGVRAQRLAHAREEAKAREEARIDSLTGLHNRRAFDEMLDLEMKHARRLGVPLSVGMLDIENFKQINDRWGYAEGDRCLRGLADVLKTSLRRPDLCFRWGGDEFAVILSGTPAEAATPIGRRLHAAVSSDCRRPDNEPVKIRFAVAEMRDRMRLQELVEMAGLALASVRSGAER